MNQILMQVPSEGHYACTCYHPLFVFNQFGDLERSALRPGNVHSADGWDGTLKPVVMRYQGKVHHLRCREGLAAVHTSLQSCRKAGKSANVHANSGAIRGIPVGSRANSAPTSFRE